MSGSEKPRDASAEEKEIRLNFWLGIGILPFGSFLGILLVGFAVYNLVNGTSLLGGFACGRNRLLDPHRFIKGNNKIC